MKMKKSLLALLIAVAAATSTCRAQPADDAGKAANPPNAADAQKAALDKAMAEARTAMDKVAAMTPVQRRAYVDQIFEGQLRTLMTANGLNDLEIQEKVVLYVREQSAARLKVREAGARLRDALADKTSTKETLSSLLDEYTTAAEFEHERRDKAEGALRQDLELAKNPRLEGLLQLQGIIGDASWFTGGLMSGMSVVALLPEKGELPKR